MLVLNSKKLSDNEKAVHSLSNAQWIAFDNLKWEIGRDKLTKKDGEGTVLKSEKK